MSIVQLNAVKDICSKNFNDFGEMLVILWRLKIYDILDNIMLQNIFLNNYAQHFITEKRNG